MAEFNRLFKTNKAFHDFAKQVYCYLDTMKPGRILKLHKYSGEKLEWIVRTACAFMAEGYHWLDYEFSEDYMIIRHHALSHSQKAVFRRMLFPDKVKRKNPRARYYYNMNYTYESKPYTTLNQRTPRD